MRDNYIYIFIFIINDINNLTPVNYYLMPLQLAPLGRP